MKKIFLILILGVSSNVNSQTIVYNSYCVFTPNKNFVRVVAGDGGYLQATFFSGGSAIFHYADLTGKVLGTAGRKGSAFARSHVYVNSPNTAQTLRPLQINNVSFSVFDEQKTQVTNGKTETVYPICRR
jgi:hypothetical protein